MASQHVMVQVPAGARTGDILKFRLRPKSGAGDPIVLPVQVPEGAVEGSSLRVRVPHDVLRSGVRVVDVAKPITQKKDKVLSSDGTWMTMAMMEKQERNRVREMRRKRQQQLLRGIRVGDNKLVRQLLQREELLRDINFLCRPKVGFSEAVIHAPTLRTETMKDTIWFETAVGAAAAYDNVAALKLLLEAGASTNLADTRGRTACMLAATAGSANAMQWLCLHHGDLDLAERVTGETAAFFAAANGQTEILRIIGEADGDLESSCNEGWTPAIAAALDGHVDCLYMLKRFGVDLNLRVRERSALEFLEMELWDPDRVGFLFTHAKPRVID